MRASTSLYSAILPLRPRPVVRMGIGGYDEFGTPIEVVVGGNVVAPRVDSYPAGLESPAEALKATITPFAGIGEVVFAPLEGQDFIAAFFIGVALLLGPDFVLAPAGLVSDKGIRPGFALERVVGDLIDADAQWLKDRKERLAADAPLLVRAPILVLFLAAGLLVSRLLLVALGTTPHFVHPRVCSHARVLKGALNSYRLRVQSLDPSMRSDVMLAEDPSFVTSIGIISCLSGGFIELLREPLPTREERDLEARLNDEFIVFSTERLVVGGRCHERDIVRAFRQYYPRYRKRDMGRSADGISIDDGQIGDVIGTWNSRMGRPGERTKTGYWKGISLAPASRPPT